MMIFSHACMICMLQACQTLLFSNHDMDSGLERLFPLGGMREEEK